MTSHRRQDGLNIYSLKGDSPIYNVKSTIVPCIGTDYIFLYGGFDEMDNLDSNAYLLNLKTKTWEVDDKHLGLYREGQSAVYIGQGNILVFGGIPCDEFPEPIGSTSLDPSDDSTFRKDNLMMIYNIYDKKWIGPPKFALNNAPSSRSRHACCLSPDGTKIYLSGGLVNSTPLNDLYCYDLVSGTWHGPIEFASRFDHFITIYDNKLYSFGGLDKDMNHVKDSIIFYNFNDQSIGEISILQKPKFSFRAFRNYGEDNDENIDSLGEIDKSEHSYIPSDCERIFLDTITNSSIKLDICLPSWSSNSKEINISYFDLNEFQFTHLFNSKNLDLYFKRNNEQDITNYIWKQAFISEGSLFLLGHFVKSSDQSRRTTIRSADINTNNELASDAFHEDLSDASAENGNEVAVDTKLCSLLQLHLSEFGIPISQFTKSDNKSINGSMSLINDFKAILTNERFSDFEIITFINEQKKSEYNNIADLDYSNNKDMFKSIKVHKSILLARWPHFQRVISSGMNETVSNKMLIPEPYLWVKGLVFYLYTGSIEFNEFINPPYSIIDYSGLLILSNIYELSDLRCLVLFQLFNQLNDFKERLFSCSDSSIEVLLNLWKNLLISNETIFISKVIEIIKQNWSNVIRSQPFSNLSKDLIIRICQDCSDDTVIPRPKNFKKSASLSPVAARDSFDSIEDFSDPESSISRIHNNSPFLRASPLVQNRSFSIDIPSTFPALQYISDSLNENITD